MSEYDYRVDFKRLFNRFQTELGSDNSLRPQMCFNPTKDEYYTLDAVVPLPLGIKTSYRSFYDRTSNNWCYENENKLIVINASTGAVELYYLPRRLGETNSVYNVDNVGNGRVLFSLFDGGLTILFDLITKEWNNLGKLRGILTDQGLIDLSTAFNSQGKVDLYIGKYKVNGTVNSYYPCPDNTNDYYLDIDGEGIINLATFDFVAAEYLQVGLDGPNILVEDETRQQGLARILYPNGRLRPIPYDYYQAGNDIVIAGNPNTYLHNDFMYWDSKTGKYELLGTLGDHHALISKDGRNILISKDDKFYLYSL